MKKNTTRKSSFKQYSITDSILFNYVDRSEATAGRKRRPKMVAI